MSISILQSVLGHDMIKVHLMDKPTYPKLAEYLSQYIVAGDVDKVAYESTVSRQTIYNILAGKRARPDNYRKLARVLGVSLKERREIYKNLMLHSDYLDSDNPDWLDEIDEESITLLENLLELKETDPISYEAIVRLVEARSGK
jgi:transcriptional regulator with XRE-family HTH domain